MNGLDLFLGALIALAAFSGFRRGALLQVITYAGMLVGLAGGALLAPVMARLVSSPSVQAGVALGTLFTVAGMGDAIGWAVGSRVRARAHETRLRWIDAGGGSLVSVVAVLLAAWFVALNLSTGPIAGLSRQIRQSAIVRALDEALPEPPGVLAEVRRFLNRFGFPEVFSGLPPAPAGPVKGPTQKQAQRAFEAAAPSTVRVVGRACGEILEGTGFVVAPSYVLTNAHVVAGVDAPQVQQQSGKSQEAAVVLYDPKVDLAVLHVDRTPGPVLHLVTAEVGRGAKGAVLGYPGGGDLTGGKAAVRRAIEATGRDIYGRGTVDRDVYELQATVKPGNSGGPFVLENGEVAGVVFAASTTDPGVAYAIASPDVRPDLQDALGRTDPVPTGACIR